ncbi:MAG: hypothetical protein WCL34_00760 [Methylococcaceae bacterium]
MTAFTGINNNGDQKIDISGLIGQTFNTVVMYGGNDTVNGSGVIDYIVGGYGNDLLKGNGGNDYLNGETGNDSLYGGTGKDSLYGGVGDDLLNGEAHLDYLYGGAGNDTYVHDLTSGNDIINDNVTVTGTIGTVGIGGGTSDVLKFSGLSISFNGFLSANSIVASYSVANKVNLYVSSYSDLSDNRVVDDGVMIQNYYQGGNYVIERIAGSDGIPYLLNAQVIPFFGMQHRHHEYRNCLKQ